MCVWRIIFYFILLNAVKIILKEAASFKHFSQIIRAYKLICPTGHFFNYLSTTPFYGSTVNATAYFVSLQILRPWCLAHKNLWCGHSLFDA
jgi:hypothetical protein